MSSIWCPLFILIESSPQKGPAGWSCGPTLRGEPSFMGPASLTPYSGWGGGGDMSPGGSVRWKSSFPDWHQDSGPRIQACEQGGSTCCVLSTIAHLLSPSTLGWLLWESWLKKVSQSKHFHELGSQTPPTSKSKSGTQESLKLALLSVNQWFKSFKVSAIRFRQDHC